MVVGTTENWYICTTTDHFPDFILGGKSEYGGTAMKLKVIVALMVDSLVKTRFEEVPAL